MSQRTLPTSELHYHPMRVVSRRTGLSADLLRAWERRYEVVKPSRSKSGRRLYSDADIERLGLLYRATLAGRGISQVAGLPLAKLVALVHADAQVEAADSQTRQRAAAADRALSDMLGDCLRAVEGLDPAALDTFLRRAVVALSAEAFLEALVVPFLERIGALWRQGTIRRVHGHVALAVLRRVLDRVIEAAPSNSGTPNIVVATPTGQMHEFGAMLAAATAAAEGWRVTFLGTGVPVEDIAAAAKETKARAVALSIVYPAGDPALGHELRRLGLLLPPNVDLIAGRAAPVSYRGALDDIGAAIPSDLANLRSRLRDLRARRRPAASSERHRRTAG